jgi:hypothetical protein
MVVPSTAEGFRAAVSALRSLDGREDVSVHTLTLPKDRCVRLLVRNLGRAMPESVVREELECMKIRFQGVKQLRSGHRDQDPTKDHPPTPHFIISVARGPEVSKVRSLTELCGLRVLVESYVAPKVHCNVSAVSALDTCSVTADTRSGAKCVGLPPLRRMPYDREQAQCCSCVGNHRRTTGVVLIGKNRRRLLQSRRPTMAERATLPLRKLSGPNLLVPTQSSTSHSRKSLISSITFPSKHGCSWLVGTLRPSAPSSQGQPARGLS